MTTQCSRDNPRCSIERCRAEGPPWDCPTNCQYCQGPAQATCRMETMIAYTETLMEKEKPKEDST